MKIKQIFQSAALGILVCIILVVFSIFGVLSYSLLFDYQNNSENWLPILILGLLGLVCLFLVVFLNKKWELGIKSSDFAE